MKFENKKEEYIYYAMKCEKAKETNDKNTYLLCLQKMKELLEELEESRNSNKN